MPAQPRNRRLRIAQIIRAITQSGPLTYAELGDKLGINSSEWIGELAATGEELGLLQGLTSSGDLAPGSKRGRPAATRFVEITRAAGGCVIGLNVGRTYFAIGVADPNGRLLSANGKPPDKDLRKRDKDARWSRYRAGQMVVHKRGPGMTGTPLLNHIAQKTVQWVEKLEIDEAQIRGITLSLPAPVSTTRSKTLTSSIEPTLDGIESIERAFKAAMGADRYPNLQKVVLANDADVAARVEVRFGEAHGYTDVVAIHAAFGAGAGVITDGKVLRTGAGGGAGEIGHCTPGISRDVDSEHGLVELNPELPHYRCVCDRPGHLEAMAGGEAIVRRIEGSLGRTKTGPPQRLETVLRDESADIAKKLDEVLKSASGRRAWEPGREALLDAAHMIGGAAHTLAHLFNPEAIFITGKLSEAGEWFLEMAQAGFDNRGPLAGYTPPIAMGLAADPNSRRRIMVNGAAMTAVRATEPLFFVRNPDFETTGEFQELPTTDD